MRKMYILCFTIMFALSLLLAGCSDKQTSEAGSSVSTSSPNNAVTANDQFPIVKDKITLKVLMKGNPDVEDFNTNGFTKWLEEKTNIHVDFSIADPKNLQEKLNLALSSGDLPDVILNLDVSPAQQMLYGSQGVIIPLQDLIEQNAPNVKKMFNERPEIKQAITAPGGNIYSLPRVNDCFHCALDRKMYVYQPWLKKLNLQEPTTPDEFEQMLLAFKNQDPNGNGKKDEIPLAAAIGSAPSEVEVFLMNAFIYDDSTKRLLLENGKIDVAYNKPGWKDGLIYLHKLYSEGLIAPQSLTQDRASLKKMAENPDVPILGAAPAHSPSSFTVVDSPSKRWVDFQPIKPLKGPTGLMTATYVPYDNISNGQFMITKANKHVAESIRWADAFYKLEVGISANIGVQGKDWDMAKPGDKGRDEQQSVYTVINPVTGTQNRTWDGLGLGYLTDKDYYRGLTVKAYPDKEKMYYDVTKVNYDPYKQIVDKIVPPLYFTKDESTQVAEVETNLITYMQTMKAKFINGDADINKEWDNYVKTLDGMGLKQYLSIYQQAYDKKVGKK